MVCGVWCGETLCWCQVAVSLTESVLSFHVITRVVCVCACACVFFDMYSYLFFVYICIHIYIYIQKFMYMRVKRIKRRC